MCSVFKNPCILFTIRIECSALILDCIWTNVVMCVAHVDNTNLYCMLYSAYNHYSYWCL